jgi:hypothetical protein
MNSCGFCQPKLPLNVKFIAMESLFVSRLGSSAAIKVKRLVRVGFVLPPAVDGKLCFGSVGISVHQSEASFIESHIARPLTDKVRKIGKCLRMCSLQVAVKPAYLKL